MTLLLDAQMVSLGYQRITSLSTAKKLSPPSGASYALLAVAGQDIRWRDDSVVPTATVGMPLPAGKELWFNGDLHKILFIEQTAGAEVNVMYYRPY